MNKPSIISLFTVSVKHGFILSAFSILPRGKGEKFNRIYTNDERIYIFSKTKEDVAKNLTKLKRAALKFCSSCRKDAKAQFEAAQNTDFTKITFEEVTDNEQ